MDGTTAGAAGGGIRDLETIERYLDIGVTYVIIGTARSKCRIPA